MKKILSWDQYEIIKEDHPNRQNIEKLIADKYLKIYSAKLSHFMDNIICVYKNKRIVALAGINIKSKENPYYLDRYLENGIENYIMENIENLTAQNKIAEIGNFVSMGNAGGIMTIVCLTHWLKKNHYKWAVCTITKQLRSIFNKINLEIIKVVSANKERLSLEEQASWGSYYDHSPMVCIISVNDTYELLKNKFNAFNQNNNLILI